MSKEPLEMVWHCCDIARYQHPAGVSCHSKHLRIRRPVGNYSLCSAKIDGRFPPPQPRLDLRIEVRVSLKRNLQRGLVDRAC